MSRTVIGNERCIICGYWKFPSEQKQLQVPLCSFCGSPKFMATLEEVIKELDTQIDEADLIDCNANPLFSFVADLGNLGTQHPFLASIRKVLGQLIRQVTAEGIADLYKLRSSGARFRHIVRVLGLLEELGLISFDCRNGTIKPTTLLFSKVATTVEVDFRLERASTFVLGYFILKAIERTLHLIKERGTLYLGEGITKIYPRNRQSQVKVLKEYTALLSFVFGYSWALAMNEFDESLLRRFLLNRGIMGREYYTVKNWFTRSHPGSDNKLYTFETHKGVDNSLMCIFKLNPEYQRIRDRILERVRERERKE